MRLDLVSSALVFLAAASASASVRVDGRRLIVDDQPFVARCLNYQPTPIGKGGGVDWTSYPQVVTADLALMQQMGANTVRVYVQYGYVTGNWAPHDPAGTVDTSRYEPVLAEAAARGIRVILNYWLPPDFMGYQQQHAERFRKLVDAFKAHPAVLMWALGNENNNGDPAMFAFFDSAIAGAKRVDPTHPFTVVLVENGDVGDDELLAKAPSVDVWSLNVYQSEEGYDHALTSYLGGTNKPLLVTEWGRDAADGEDEQASFLADRWKRIESHLSATDPSRHAVGGCVFEWNDEWWKLGNPSGQERGGGETAQGSLNEEWFGLAGALRENQAGPRPLRKAYATLKAAWTASRYANEPPVIAKPVTPSRSAGGSGQSGGSGGVAASVATPSGGSGGSATGGTSLGGAGARTDAPPARSGCSVGHGPRRAPWPLALLVVASSLARWRRRRHETVRRT